MLPVFFLFSQQYKLTMAPITSTKSWNEVNFVLAPEKTTDKSTVLQPGALSLQ